MTDDPTVSAGEARALYDELLRLTEDCWARVGAGDEGGLEDFARRQTALLDRLGHASPPPEAEPAIRRLLALSADLIALLRTRKAPVGQELKAAIEARLALTSYRGAGPRTASYIDHVS